VTRVAVALVAALALAALALAACDPGATPSPSGAASTVRGTVSPGSLGPPATVAPGETPLVRIDPSLLAILPGSVDGLSVLESSEGDADAASNSSLARIADAAVGALAIDPVSGNFVFPLVVHLRVGALDDAGFRSWRDAYDTGACAGSGVVGHAESQLGGRTVFVGTCANGLHTYHAWLAERGILVSASAGGDRRLGEVLFASLRP